MKAKLIASTKPVDGLDADLTDIKELVAYCARVSNPSNQNSVATSDKLIKYLLKHKHFSPFEMVNLVLEIEITRDVARQLLRHRSFTFQEFSQRYADPTKDLSFEIFDARLQDPTNRQNSINLDLTNPDHRELNKIWRQKQAQIIRFATEDYLWAVSNGIAKEIARKLLPEGLTNSRLYVNGTLRSWIHYIDVRTPEGTQPDHRSLANECAVAIAKEFSMINDFNNFKK